MPTVRSILWERLRLALSSLDFPVETAEISAATDGRFGDYQSNTAMVLARHLGRPPRELAATIRDAIKVDGVSAPPEIAGAGFLNFRLLPDFIDGRVAHLVTDYRCGVEIVTEPKTIVIDFSSPNVAKPMHVGHIRSTILGDSLSRIARFLGHRVIADNHIGDWGTQFGKVIYGWKNLLDPQALETEPLGELVRLYRDVTALEADNEAVRSAVREELVKLQQGDPENRAIWQRVIDVSRVEFDRIYALLGVKFDVQLGESFYNGALGPLVDRLEKLGLARRSEGALCIFFPKIPDLADKPCIVRKRDGGFLYATTDLATIEYRVLRWNPDAVWYITGAPQALHFQQVFEAARLMGYRLDAQHIAFGSILGEDRKIMRTRSGENVQLGDVLREAIERARAIIEAKNPSLPEEEKALVAGTVGIGAVKYAELSQHRMTDYVFSWDKLLAFQGNTAPYLQNAYVRIRSIFRKLDAPFDPASVRIALGVPAERILALKVLQFAEVVPLVLEDFRPNLLANYLYELAITFHNFYETCPVLKASSPSREIRLALCDLVARTLRSGLDLLGIEVPDRM